MYLKIPLIKQTHKRQMRKKIRHISNPSWVLKSQNSLENSKEEINKINCHFTKQRNTNGQGK